MKGIAERPVMTIFWILFALAAAAVFAMLAMFVYTKLVGIHIT